MGIDVDDVDVAFAVDIDDNDVVAVGGRVHGAVLGCMLVGTVGSVEQLVSVENCVFVEVDIGGAVRAYRFVAQKLDRDVVAMVSLHRPPPVSVPGAVYSHFSSDVGFVDRLSFFLH